MAQKKQTILQKNSKGIKGLQATQAQRWLQGMSKGFFSLFIIITLILAVYAPTLFFELTDFDDSAFLATGFTLWADVFQHLRVSIANDLYRPLFFATITINNLVLGASPAALHAGNILLHILVTYIVFTALHQTFYDRMVALSGALIFAVHPLNVQAVAWIPGRNDTTLALLFFLAFLTLPQNSEQNQNFLWVVHFLFFSSALFVKETALAFPLIACVYFWVQGRSYRQTQTLLYIFLWLVALIIYALCRIYTETSPIHRSFLFHHVFLFDALRLNWQTLPAIVGKMLIPVNLSGYAGFYTSTTILGIIVFLGLGSGFFVPGINKKRYIFWFAWLITVVGLPMLRHQVRSGEFDYLEHRSYLAIPAFLGLLAEWYNILPLQKQRMSVYYLLPIVALFLYQSISHTKHFYDAPTFWGHALLSHPQSATAHATLGQYWMQKEGASVRTEDHFTKAVQYAPHDVRYWTFLGLLHGQQGKILQAEQDLLQGHSQDSTYPDLLYNLGYATYLRHNKADSVYGTVLEYYKKALTYDNRHRNTYLNIIGLCFNRGDFEHAWKYFQEAEERGLNLEADKPGLKDLLQSKRQ